jgi:tetratricopeptide (TPR) repeat protein
MKRNTSEVSRNRGQRLLILIGVVSMCAVFLYPTMAHFKITFDRISLLGELAASRDPYTIRMRLGNLYTNAGEYDKAIDCYRSALPHQLTKFDHSLRFAWQRLDLEDASNPRMHLGFGEMFQSFGEIQQAELEYKQALTLSPGDKEIRARLADIAILKKLRVNRELGRYSAETLHQQKEYGPDLAARWLPPMHEGCLLTRCNVASNPDGHVDVSVLGLSGSDPHDRSAVSALRSADFSDLFKYDPAALYECACMSDGNAKTVAFTKVLGECNFYTETPSEQLASQVKRTFEWVNKQAGVLQL